MLANLKRQHGLAIPSCTLAEKSLKAIVVLGGGRLPQGGQTPLSMQRLDAAVKLYANGEGACITVLGGALSTYLPNALEFVTSGAEERAHYLIAQGVPSEDILQIRDGRDTIAEALAFKVRFASLGITHFTLVTSELHVPRASWVFETVLEGMCPFKAYGVPCGGILLADEEAMYLKATKAYFASHSDWRGTVACWHHGNPALYVEFKRIHDLFHPPGKESQAYFAVRA